MAPQIPYRVLLVDDHEIVRSGVRALLESQTGISVCGEATDGIEAVEQVRNAKPNLVLLDLTMPGMNGLDVLRTIRQISPESDVLILSMHFSEAIAREALRAGARGYVLKSDANTELLVAFEHLRNRRTYFTSRLASCITETYCHGSKVDPGWSAGETHLSRREIQVIRLLADGNSNKQVAAHLGVSRRTVESHREHIMHKMKFSNFSELIRFALRNNLVANQLVVPMTILDDQRHVHGTD